MPTICQALREALRCEGEQVGVPALRILTVWMGTQTSKHRSTTQAGQEVLDLRLHCERQGQLITSESPSPWRMFWKCPTPTEWWVPIIRDLADSFRLSFLLFIYLFLFLAVLGLRFCARAFSSCGERGPLFIAVRGPLTVAASLVAEHRLQTRRLSSCGAWA